MTRHGMPFLVLNLGVEMIFVLHSRLRAQAVAADKSEDVMRDIGTNLFSAAFVTELFTPQPLYTPASVMQVFATLSRSSVMHLSDNSMKKLYDLVFMTVKYQVLTLRHPLELYELTLNHLETAMTLLAATLHSLLQETVARVHSLAASFSIGDWAAARRALLNFFGGRHVRVSVFLDNSVQNAATGAFYIPKDTYLTPLSACAAPGLITMPATQAAAAFEHPDALLPYPPNIPVGAWDPANRATRMTTNGFDMYAAATTAPRNASGAAAVANGRGVGGFADPLARQTRELPRPRQTGNSSYSTSAQALSRAESQQAYDASINYLARIAGSGSRAPGVQCFELELFEDPLSHTSATSLASTTSLQTSGGQPAQTAAAAAAAPAPPSDAAPPAVPLARMTADAVQEQNRRLFGILNDFDTTKGGAVREGRGGPAATATSGGANDLLDIMDEI